MPYSSGRAGPKLDLAAALKVCPYCLGDLVMRPDLWGGHYSCLYCGARGESWARPKTLSDLDMLVAREGAAVAAAAREALSR